MWRIDCTPLVPWLHIVRRIHLPCGDDLGRSVLFRCSFADEAASQRPLTSENIEKACMHG